MARRFRSPARTSEAESLDWLALRPESSALVVDGTVGGGGHALEAILRADQAPDWTPDRAGSATPDALEPQPGRRLAVLSANASNSFTRRSADLRERPRRARDRSARRRRCSSTSAFRPISSTRPTAASVSPTTPPGTRPRSTCGWTRVRGRAAADLLRDATSVEEIAELAPSPVCGPSRLSASRTTDRWWPARGRAPLRTASGPELADRARSLGDRPEDVKPQSGDPRLPGPAHRRQRRDRRPRPRASKRPSRALRPGGRHRRHRVPLVRRPRSQERSSETR